MAFVTDTQATIIKQQTCNKRCWCVCNKRHLRLPPTFPATFFFHNMLLVCLQQTPSAPTANISYSQHSNNKMTMLTPHDYRAATSGHKSVVIAIYFITVNTWFSLIQLSCQNNFSSLTVCSFACFFKLYFSLCRLLFWLCRCKYTILPNVFVRSLLHVCVVFKWCITLRYCELA